jgi:hypothetical protein
LLTFTATATDADDPANTLTFSLEGTVPSGAGITAGGVFTWTPTEAQGPSDYSITVRVTDNGSPALYDEETINVHVNEVAVPVNLIRNPGFEVHNATWIESVNNLDSDRADHYYDNDERSGTHDGRTDSRSPNSNGNAYAMLTQNLDATAVSSVPDVTNSLTVYLFRRNTASDGTRSVEVRINAGSYMLSYIWCTTGQLPSDTATQKYIRIGDVSSISTSSYSSLIRNLRADWVSKGLSTSLQLSSIQLVSNGYREGGGWNPYIYYGQDIVWDDLQLLYLP